MVHMEPMTGLPALDLDNLVLVNARLDSGPVSLTANEDITSLPAWFLGENPDESGRLHNATSCVVILVESEKDAAVVDAFYFYFYSYNRASNISQALPPIQGLLEKADMDHEMHFGDHVGDW